MRVAVTGATGFIGRYIIRELVENGHHCRCWYRPGSDRSGLTEFGDHIDWVAGELATGDEAALVAHCDAVVHAALHHPSGRYCGGEGDLVDFVEKNVVGTIRLIEEARASGAARFVFISTCAVHEKILDDRPLDERHPLWPTSHYGAHKAAIEKFVHSYGLGKGFPICALRPTGVYGVAHPPEASRWFKLVSAVVRGESVTCRRGGKEVHAADVARAVNVLLNAPEELVTGLAFNCYDQYISEYDIANIVRQITGIPAEIHGGPQSPKHQIVTDQLRSLGMDFGGDLLLRRTIEELVEASQK